jgi:hypothetical protein
MLLGTAAALASATLASPMVVQADSDDDDDRKGRRTPLPQPAPIPGGLAPGFQVWAPGTPGVTLPFSHFPLPGLNFDPSSMTNFDGFTALAYPTGGARGSDDKTYNLEGDMRIFSGKYVPLGGGAVREGSFAFV